MQNYHHTGIQFHRLSLCRYIQFPTSQKKKALHKAVRVMESKATIQGNKLIQLKNSMLMYGVYNTEALEKLINTVHDIHNTTSSHERLFEGQQSSLTLKSLYQIP